MVNLLLCFDRVLAPFVERGSKAGCSASIPIPPRGHLSDLVVSTREDRGLHALLIPPKVAQRISG